MTFQEKLAGLDACTEARQWVGRKSLKKAWAECPRGDWMLWFAAHAGIDKKTITAAKSECAALVLHLMRDERSRNAVEVARKYGRGEVGDQELAAAAADADAAAAAADDAYADAAYDAYADAAAYAATTAAYAAATADADAAADAAYAAATAAAADDAYAAKARLEMLAKCADAIRAAISADDISV